MTDENRLSEWIDTIKVKAVELERRLAWFESALENEQTENVRLRGEIERYRKQLSLPMVCGLSAQLLERAEALLAKYGPLLK